MVLKTKLIRDSSQSIQWEVCDINVYAYLVSFFGQVILSPDADPPVVRIMNYRYDLCISRVKKLCIFSIKMLMVDGCIKIFMHFSINLAVNDLCVYLFNNT